MTSADAPSRDLSEDEAEAFIGQEGTDGFDGVVIDDLDGEGMQGDEESSGVDEDGEAGASEDHPMDDESLQAFEGHGDAVLAVAWSPTQPDLVATGGQDDKAFLWRVGQDAAEATGGSMATTELTGHTDTVVSLAFNTAGSLLATGSLDSSVRVWQVSDGSCLQTLEGPGDGVDWVAWHPKGDILLAGSEDFTMWMWLAATGNCMQRARDGRRIHARRQADVSAGGENDCSLRVWNPKTGECTATMHGAQFHEDGITCLDVHHDGSVVITGGQDGAGIDGKFIVWDCGAFTERGLCQHPEPITRMAWDKQQPLVATGCLDGVVRLWDLRTSACVKQLHGHSSAVQDVVLSPMAACCCLGLTTLQRAFFRLHDMALVLSKYSGAGGKPATWLASAHDDEYRGMG
ncbi:WD40-repeat-containing domain protein [Scenedesmus sp. NREL 46B-D3]|nr:WD40-repeat-containing domain protein [Scenedesmus sp. NREL 46B-D3]